MSGDRSCLQRVIPAPKNGVWPIRLEILNLLVTCDCSWSVCNYCIPWEWLAIRMVTRPLFPFNWEGMWCMRLTLCNVIDSMKFVNWNKPNVHDFPLSFWVGGSGPLDYLGIRACTQPTTIIVAPLKCQTVISEVKLLHIIRKMASIRLKRAKYIEIMIGFYENFVWSNTSSQAANWERFEGFPA